MAVSLFFIISLFIIFLLLLRLCFILPFVNLTKPGSNFKSKCKQSLSSLSTLQNKKQKDHIMILLGSGGHTGEIMRIIANMDFSRFDHLTWVLTSNDIVSMIKAHNFEVTNLGIKSVTDNINYINVSDELRIKSENSSLISSQIKPQVSSFSSNRRPKSRKSTLPNRFKRNNTQTQKNNDDDINIATQNSGLKIDYIVLPRARKINQSMVSSIFTTLICLLKTFHLILFKTYSIPGLILCNGPGTSVPLCYIVFLVRFLSMGLISNSIIYIESLARVKNLSLSGWLLYPIVNRFIVQWERLHKKFRRSDYYGILV